MKLVNLFLITLFVTQILGYTLLPNVPQYTEDSFPNGPRNLFGGNQQLLRGRGRGFLGNRTWVPQGRYWGGKFNRWGTGWSWNRHDRYE
jgi:hypothetical protein